jgi:Flp pilus assembly protein TadD
MSRPSLKTYAYITIILILGFYSVAEAENFYADRPATQEEKPQVKKKAAPATPVGPKNLSEQQRMARAYREDGIKEQQVGNIKEAVAFYQKSIELDPAYPDAYNDLGIIYEAEGATDRAEENYLQAMRVDSNYLSAYSNLALLYENKRDLEKAAFYWQKRADLGPSGDPWTERAKQRLADIRLVYPRPGADYGREQEALNLLNDVAMEKEICQKDDRAQARKLFKKAKLAYEKEDFAAAIMEAVNAQNLDRDNQEIQDFIEQVQRRALSR